MKKIFALLLSVAMAASLFVGVAFAAPAAALTVNVSAPVAMNQTVTISGALLPVGAVTLPGGLGAGIALQRLAPGASVWTNLSIFDAITGSMTPVLVPMFGQFSFAHRFEAAGSYRVAFVNGAGLELNAQGALATPHLVHILGTVAPLPLTITTPTVSLPWGGNNVISIPLTVTRQAVGGNVVPVLPNPALATLAENVPAHAVGTFTLAYSGGAVTSTYRISGGVATFEITRGAAALTGTLLITVTDDTLGWSGQIVINLVTRAPFNAVSRLTAAQPVLEAGRLVTFETTVFTGAGAALPLNEYSVTTFAGPIAATAPLVIIGDATLAPQTGTATASRRVTGLGTITVTTRFYRIHVLANGTEDHREIGTAVVETFAVRAGVVTNVAGGRVGQTVTLSATVTGLDNNPLNTGRVVFRAPIGTPFVLRNPVTGLFPTDLATAAGVDTVTIDGWALTRNPGFAVANGVYTAEVMLRNVTAASAISVEVLPLNHTNGQYDLPIWITRTLAGTVLPRLYTSTLAQSTFVTEHRETLTVTIRDAAGNLVTDQLAAPALTHMTATITPARLEWAAIQVSPGVWSGDFLSSEPGTVRVRMHGTGGNTLNGAEFTVTVVNPRVQINTSTTLVTSDFFEDITVSLFDPRNDQPISLPLQVREGRVALPNGATPITANLSTQIPVAAGAGFASAVASDRDLPRATVHTFRVLTWATQQRLLGVEQPGGLRYMVSAGGASTAELFVQTLAPATIALSPTELRAGVANRVTLTLRNAHGVAFGSIPQQGAGAAIVHAVPREIVAAGRWNHSFDMPENGIADMIIDLRRASNDGLIAGNNRFDVLSDRPTFLVNNVTTHHIALRSDVRVVAPLDTASPVIAVTAPATTTAATAQILVTVTDDNMIALDGVAFNGVRFEMNAVPTFAFTRNVDLVLGANHFIVSAMDTAGNVTNQTITITRTAPAAADTAAPVIEVTVPAVTTEATAVVTVTVRDAVNIAANGIIFDGVVIPGFVSREQVFTRTVNLREGMNIFTVAAQDAAGNVATRVIAVERRTPPAPVSHVITIGRANPAIGLDVPANVRNGRLMVPFRWFGERILEATVDYRVVGTAEIVTLVKGNISVELTLNSTIAKVNGTPVSLDVAAFATGGRTLVPARFLAETFGYTVNWNPADDSVTISKR